MAYIFDASKGETPQSVAERRRVADSLAARIFGNAPKNVGEGLNALGQAWIAASMRDEAVAAQKAGTASGNNAFSSIVGMINGTAPAAPVIAPAPSVVPGVPTTGKIYSNDEPSPLDPPSGADRDMAVRTIVAEAGNQPQVGKEAVAAVLRNRAVAGNFGGDTLPGVIQKPMQFEPWNTQAGRNRMAAIDPNSPAYQTADAALTSAYAGGDPTNGATHFYAPKAQAALGRPAPKWDNGSGVDIADHRFFGGAGTPAVTAGATPTDVSSQSRQPAAAPAQARASGPDLATLMQAAANPWLSEGQRAVVQTMLKQRLEAEQHANDPLRQLQIKKAEKDLSDDKNPESVREFEYARSNGFKGSYQDWIASKRAGAGEYGLNAIWGTGPDGKPAIIQLGKGGKPILTPMPEGFQPNKDAQKVDLGSHWGILDPVTRNLTTTIPKDLRGVEREKGVGEAQGKALASAPQDIQAGQNAIDLLDKIETHPYLERGTGFSSLANLVPGTGGYDFSNIVEQAKGGAFLQAVQQMRGLGALSNAEGGAATAAITRMNTSSSKEAFLDAVKDFRKIVNQGMERAQARLNEPSATNPGTKKPGGPSVEDLLKKYGGS